MAGTVQVVEVVQAVDTVPVVGTARLVRTAAQTGTELIDQVFDTAQVVGKWRMIDMRYVAEVDPLVVVLVGTVENMALYENHFRVIVISNTFDFLLTQVVWNSSQLLLSKSSRARLSPPLLPVCRRFVSGEL